MGVEMLSAREAQTAAATSAAPPTAGLAALTLGLVAPVTAAATDPAGASVPPRTPGTGRRAGVAGWRTYATVGIAALGYLFVVGFRPLGDQAMIAFGNWCLAAAPLFGAICSLIAYRRTSGSARYGWALMAAGLTSWMAGQLAWNYYELLVRRMAPFPSVADVGFLLSVPLMLGAMALMISAGWRKVRTVLDGLIISASVFYVGWAFVLDSVVRVEHGSWLGWAVGLAYPVGRVALVSMAVIMLSLVHSVRRGPVWFLAAGALALAGGASAYAYAVNNDAYTAGGFIDIGWVGGFVLIGLSALSARPGPTPRDGDQSATLWAALPYVPLAVAIGTSVYLLVRDGSTGAFLHILGIVIVLLIIAGQMVTVRDNLLLNRRLTMTVVELRDREGQLQHLAFHDPLTGLANRALFHDRAEHAIKRQNRSREPFALIFVDLDGFKQVNDRLGHAAGDTLLRAVADRLRGCVRTSDTLARLGGDEFAIVADRMASHNDAEVIARRIVDAMERAFDLDGARARVTASVGVSLFEAGAEGIDELLRRADDAMYAAKSAGKNRYVIVR